MFDSGGMPSSHTSLVVGLTTATAYQYGLGSTMFPLSLAFSLIVMYDAAGVRRHAGKQAEVLNRILDDMFKGQSISERKLKEVLGHSPLQVLAGAVLGVFIGVVYMCTSIVRGMVLECDTTICAPLNSRGVRYSDSERKVLARNKVRALTATRCLCSFAPACAHQYF